MPSRLDRFLPPTPLARRLSVQSVLFATGQGAFITGSAVFFTQIVGLTAAQVGLGLTIAGVFAFAFAVPLGKLADRVGPKRQWAAGAFLTAALYLVWPFVGGFASYVVLVVVLELAQNAAAQQVVAPLQAKSAEDGVTLTVEVPAEIANKTFDQLNQLQQRQGQMIPTGMPQ